MRIFRYPRLPLTFLPPVTANASLIYIKLFTDTVLCCVFMPLPAQHANAQRQTDRQTDRQMHGYKSMIAAIWLCSCVSGYGYAAISHICLVFIVCEVIVSDYVYAYIYIKSM
jgi:hypothetical protein